jgi:hypothetical protein
MSLAPKTVTGTFENKRQRGFARVVVVLAWLTFWLNTAFFPCCEAVAAGFGGQPAAEVSDAHLAHDSDKTHTHHPDQNPQSTCGHIVSAGPTTSGPAAVLAAEHPNFVSTTPGVTIASLPAAISAFSLTAYPAPPPKVPLYLRDLRIRL